MLKKGPRARFDLRAVHTATQECPPISVIISAHMTMLDGHQLHGARLEQARDEHCRRPIHHGPMLGSAHAEWRCVYGLTPPLSPRREV